MPVFTANIPGNLKVGDRIEIGGKIKENARKMSVNLCAQEGEEPRDVVLHFDVRFHRDNIISLSRKNGIWIGSGNYDTNYNMFVPGTIFRIIFEVKDTDVITIYCQGKFHSNFLPKIPLNMARYVVAWADIERVTHCYFHILTPGIGGDENPAAAAGQAVYTPQSPRPTITTAIAGDIKRGAPRIRKKVMADYNPKSSNESSDEDSAVKTKNKVEGRADRFFYDTLMCQSSDHPKFGSPDSLKYRKDMTKGNKVYSNRMRAVSDSEKTESEEYSEEIGSKNMESSTVDSEMLPELKKRGRRGKFGSLAQVVNFMGKSARRN